MILKRRDIGIAVLAGVLLTLAIYYFAAISPALSKREMLDGYIYRKQKDMERMLSYQHHWMDFKESRREAEETLNRRGKAFTLLTYLEQVSRSAGIDKNIQYIKPVGFPDREGTVQPMGIEMRFEHLNIKQLVDFLYQVEHSQNLLKIPRIKIQPVTAGENRFLEVTLQVNTYGLK